MYLWRRPDSPPAREPSAARTNETSDVRAGQGDDGARRPSPCTVGELTRPELRFVGVEDIPVEETEAYHMLAFDAMERAIKEGQVACFPVAARHLGHVVELIEQEVLGPELGMEDAKVQMRYDQAAELLYVWSSVHGPWAYMHPALCAGDLPAHPRDVTIISA